MKKIKGGFFITLEGGDGCGKSTQSKILISKLKGRGYDVVYAREPGTTPLTEGIRDLLLFTKEKRSAETDLLLFEASRRHFTENVVIPNMKDGKIIISDRYFDSTTAYQGYGGGVSLKIIEELNRFASCNIYPNITFVINVSERKGLEKTLDKKDNFGSRGLDFHKRVNEGYQKIAIDNPKRCFLIDYEEGDIEEMSRKIYGITLKKIKEIK